MLNFLKFREILVIFCICFWSSCIYAEENEKLESLVYHKKNDITQITLKNGLKIFLKPTSHDKNEVFIQLISPKGYTKLCKEFFHSGALSSKIALESGFGKYSNTELSYNLYKDSIELFVNINKFYTIVELSFPSESLENALSLIELIFRSEDFNSKALTKIIEKEKAQILQYLLNPEKTLGASCLALNTQNTKIFKPLTAKTINKIDLQKCSEVFRCFFSSPEDFTAVIVGDFIFSNVKNQIIDKLGAIQKRNSNISIETRIIPVFPEGIVRKTIPCEKVRDPYSVVTLPLKNKLTFKGLCTLQLAARLLEERLQKIVLSQTGRNYGADVSYEFPFYPSLEQVWFNIQFQGTTDKLKNIEKELMNELNRLKTYEIDKYELNQLIIAKKNRVQFLKSNNVYWLSIIANFSLWNWDFSLIDTENTYYDEINPSDLREFINENFSTKNYTVVTVQS